MVLLCRCFLFFFLDLLILCFASAFLDHCLFLTKARRDKMLNQMKSKAFARRPLTCCILSVYLWNPRSAPIHSKLSASVVSLLFLALLVYNKKDFLLLGGNDFNAAGLLFYLTKTNVDITWQKVRFEWWNVCLMHMFFSVYAAVLCATAVVRISMNCCNSTGCHGIRYRS